MVTYHMQSSRGAEEFMALGYREAISYVSFLWPGWPEDVGLLLYEIDYDNQRLRPIWFDSGPGEWLFWGE